MKSVIFTLVLSANILLIVGVLISILLPKYRLWPPPRKHSWQFWFIWILDGIGMIGVPVVGVLDWETISYTHWSRFLIGCPLILFGIIFSLWAIRTLSVHQSFGLKGTLVTSGPYQYTRNPQYIADIFSYTGIILVTSSSMALITGTLVVLLFLLLPFSEEPWLRQQFGKQYEEYCRNVPRFIGLQSFRSSKN
jgi:protein-S-isoprenylcysteine O-methyltransferase Ste14